MTEQREIVRAHCLRRLDREATVHPADHQTTKAARYLLPREGRMSAPLMIEKEAGKAFNIWCRRADLDERELAGIAHRPSSPAGSTGGRPGRHSALTTMSDMARADLWCIAPETVGEVDRVLDAICGKSP